MSQLSWGKPTIEKTTYADGTPSSSWTGIDCPKEGTSQLTTEAGTETEATEEGGGVIDSRTGKTKYTFEFDLFVKKGGTRPFADEDGVIAGEYAIRLTPEDEECEGFLIERCTIRVEESWTSEDGKLLHYVCKALKPKTGKILKPYTKE